MRYILITFYNRGTQDRPIWEVYGHKGKYNNDLIKGFGNEQDAMFEAHGYCLPVMRGTSNSMEISKMLDLLDT